MPSTRYTVTFSDVVVPQRLYSGGRFIGFSEDSFDACPTKTFADVYAYENWSRTVNNKYRHLTNLEGSYYRMELAEMGLSTHHTKDDILNVLRFGERWCERNVPPKMCRHLRIGKVIAPRPQFMDEEDEDARVTSSYNYEDRL